MHITIVGSGLAGLSAAITAARNGTRVTVLERAAEVGGRATTSERQGYLFNIGPHALYARAEAILKELGVAIGGTRPPLERTVAWRGGKPHLLPLGTEEMLMSDLLDEPESLEAQAVFSAMFELDTRALQGITLDTWLDANVRAPAVRSLLETLVRVSSYSHAPQLVSAGAHIDQLRATATAGVRYIDGGWQTIVEGLRERALEAGVRFATAARATSVTRTGAGWRVASAAGHELDADAVILAVGPRVASKLVASSSALARWSESAVPVEVASLDIALSRLPSPSQNYSVGVDRPLYFSVHSVAARLAPPGGSVLHAAMYLPPSTRPDPEAVLEELEWLVDQLQPGWRDVLVHRRYMPHVMVTNAFVTAADGGLAGRPGPLVPDATGLYVAGDWVGPVGMLSDAALASGVAAGQLASRHHEKAVA